MTGFATLHDEFTKALLLPSNDVPKGLIALKAPNIQKRFNVYRNNVMHSLIEAMKANFPICLALVGDAFFVAMVGEFVSKQPPKLPMLFEYGDELPNFISEFPPVASIPYLSDIAELENLWRKAYHSADVRALNISELQKVAAEDQMSLVFNIHPSASILKSGWPIFSIWQGHEQDNMAQIDLDVGQNIIICRPDVDVLMINLEHSACVFFRTIMNKQTLSVAYEKAVEEDSEFDLSHCFGQLFAIGLIVGFDIK